MRTIDFLVDLNQRVKGEVEYVIRMEPGVQTCEETLGLRNRVLPRLGVAAGRDDARIWVWPRVLFPAI